jgi:glycosyltransferase involved in cell wall biosynthesis
VSIITAVHNAASTVPTTVHSIASQDYPHIEHIVVDGASTDDSVAAVERSGARVAMLVSEPDRGVYDAFNKGLRLATGEVIGFLNAGDSYTSTSAVRHVVEALARDGTDAVFADVEIVDPADPSRVLRRVRSRTFEPGRLASGFMPAHPTLFFRREVYGRCGSFDPTYRIAGDFEFCLRAFLAGHATYSYIPEVLVTMPAGGLSTRGWRSKWIITREMHRACVTHGVETSIARLLLRFPAKLMEVVLNGR